MGGRAAAPPRPPHLAPSTSPIPTPLRRPLEGERRPPYYPRRKLHRLWGRQPSRPPAQARAWSWTATSPQLADASAPSPASPCGSAGADLARPPRPPPSSSVASAAVRMASSPRRSAPRKLLAELPALSSSVFIADGDLPTHKGRVGRAGDCGREKPSSVPPSRPPNPRPPALFHFPRPRAPQRAVAFRTFPPPSARELPAPGSGGGGANAGREFR